MRRKRSCAGAWGCDRVDGSVAALTPGGPQRRSPGHRSRCATWAARHGPLEMGRSTWAARHGRSTWALDSGRSTWAVRLRLRGIDAVSAGGQVRLRRLQGRAPPQFDGAAAEAVPGPGCARRGIGMPGSEAGHRRADIDLRDKDPVNRGNEPADIAAWTTQRALRCGPAGLRHPQPCRIADKVRIGSGRLAEFIPGCRQPDW